MEIQMKYRACESPALLARCDIISLWRKITACIAKHSMPCQAPRSEVYPQQQHLKWFLGASQAMVKKLEETRTDDRIQKWNDLSKFPGSDASGRTSSGPLPASSLHIPMEMKPLR